MKKSNRRDAEAASLFSRSVFLSLHVSPWFGFSPSLSLLFFPPLLLPAPHFTARHETGDRPRGLGRPES